MTCIVGVKSESGVVLGGDLQGSAGWSSRQRKDVKVFALNDRVACGFTSSYRMGQILRFHVSPPEIVGDEYAWAVRDFIPVVRAAFKDHGYIKVENTREEGGTFLLAVRNRLFSVQDDFQVAEAEDPYDSCGCGYYYALGALYVLGDSDTPRARVRTALKAAARFSNGVGDTFSFVETKA